MRRLAYFAGTATVLLVILGSLDRYTTRYHEFSVLNADLDDGARLALTVSGYWKTNPDGSEEQDGRYAVSIRVWGTGGEVEVASVRITDPVTGDEEVPSEWAEPVRDPADGALLLFHRRGVPLSFSDKDVEGELIVRRGQRVSRYLFRGSLSYSYREETGSRLIAALMSA